MTLTRRKRKSQRGAAQVEFALSILMVVFLMFWVFEMVMVVYTYSVLSDAAKEGVRYAIVRGSEVLIAHHDTVIESEDHVILFVVDKKRIPEVERLFQVGVAYI